MFFQQEIWLVLVGLIVAKIVQKTNGTHVAYQKIAFWSCVISLLIGEIGMITQLFFPSDVLGVVLTTLGALLAAKVVIGERTRARAQSFTNTRSRTINRKK